MSLHVHAPAPSDAVARSDHCPCCERKRVFVAFFTEWYGWDVTCLGCGNNWQDGELIYEGAYARDCRGRFDGGRSLRESRIERARKRYRGRMVVGRMKKREQ